MDELGGNVAREIPRSVKRHLNDWKSLQRFWFILHYSCGLTGVVAAVLASRFDFWLWGIVAAVATSVVTLLGPLQKGESYKHGYYGLASAIDRFESIPTTAVDWLLEEHRAMQQIVLSRDTRSTVEQAPIPIGKSI